MRRLVETHKLKGKLTGCWACSIRYDLRIVFDFIRSDKNEEDIFLIEIGSYEEVLIRRGLHIPGARKRML